jgi:hypothetical protein
MRLLYDQQTAALRPYPRPDDEPVVGLDPRYISMALIQEPQPAYDPATERLEPTEAIDLDALTVTRGWAIIPIEPPAPPEPAPDWLGFAGWLYGYEPMAAAMEAARASRDPQGEPATTGLPAAMDEARLRSNYVPFALSWGLFLAASGLPPDEVGAIVARATECHLPAQFVAALQPAT